MTVSGKVTEIAAGVKTAYDGGRFLPDGKRIMLLSDKDSDTMRLVEINLATGAQSVRARASVRTVENARIALIRAR